MKRVIIESPYGGPERERNVVYARAAMRDSLARGEAPFLSHLLYTQVLDDDVPKDRHTGMKAGFAWSDLAERVVVYTDLGISPGMQTGIDEAMHRGAVVEHREVPGWVWCPKPDTTGLLDAIARIERELPGWWFSFGWCSVSSDASLGPDRQWADARMLELPLFDGGFHCDLSQPATMAEAMNDAIDAAVAARREFITAEMKAEFMQMMSFGGSDGH